jgi:aminopeptidase N
MGRRRLKNLALSYMSALNKPAVHHLCLSQFQQANNMTDVIAALHALVNVGCPEAKIALQEFHDRWHEDSLVMDKWFAIQAMSEQSGTLSEVRRLSGHPLFDMKNPNRVRALIGAFVHENPVNFHARDGEGYRFLTEHVLQIDAMNPQVAARLAKAFAHWRKHDEVRAGLMRSSLEEIARQGGLSKDVYEIVTKSLSE